MIFTELPFVLDAVSALQKLSYLSLLINLRLDLRCVGVWSNFFNFLCGLSGSI